MNAFFSCVVLAVLSILTGFALGRITPEGTKEFGPLLMKRWTFWAGVTYFAMLLVAAIFLPAQHGSSNLPWIFGVLLFTVAYVWSAARAVRIVSGQIRQLLSIAPGIEDFLVDEFEVIDAHTNDGVITHLDISYAIAAYKRADDGCGVVYLQCLARFLDEVGHVCNPEAAVFAVHPETGLTSYGAFYFGIDRDDAAQFVARVTQRYEKWRQERPMRTFRTADDLLIGPPA
jgi:hypothetical protein